MLHLSAVLLLLLPLHVVADAYYRCQQGAMPPAVHDEPLLRVASLNIGHGRGKSRNQMLVGRAGIEENLDRAAAALQSTETHLVALQELDEDSRWAGNFDHAARLLENTSLVCAAVGLHAQNWLYRFGTGLLAHFSLDDPRALAFEPTPPTTNKGLVAATLHWRDGEVLRPVRVASVHLDFSRKSARRRQLDRIIDEVLASEVPIIVMGDFNETWEGEESVVRRLVEEGGLVAYQPESEALATYKAKRLDWVLISRELEFVTYRNVDEVLSDHRLVVAELRWRQ